MKPKFGAINKKMIDAAAYYHSGIHNLDSEIATSMSWVKDIIDNQEFMFISENCPINTLFDLLIGNVVLLLPTIFDNYFETVKSDMRWFDFFNEFKINYDKDYNRIENANSVKDELSKFRNALEHGLYDVIYEDNEAYFLYRYIKGKDFRYKKISLKTILRLADDALKFNINSSATKEMWQSENRLAIAITNNMKVICACKTKSNIEYELPDTTFTNEYFIIQDDNFFDEMKLAAIFTEYYALYQKNLETTIGPNLWLASKQENVLFNYLEKVKKGEYFDFSKLTGAIVSHRTQDISLVSKMKDELHNQLSETKNNRSLASSYQYKMLEIEIGVPGLKERVIQPSFYKLGLMSNGINVLHHIRNAFAHGNVKITPELKIEITDKSNDEITFHEVINLIEFISLTRGENLIQINQYLNDKSNDQNTSSTSPTISGNKK